MIQNDHHPDQNLPEDLLSLARRIGRLPQPFAFDDTLGMEIMARVRATAPATRAANRTLAWTTLALGVFFIGLTASILLGAACSPALDNATVLNLTIILAPALPAGLVTALNGQRLLRGRPGLHAMTAKNLPGPALFATVLILGLISPGLHPLDSIAVALGLSGLAGSSVLALTSTRNSSKDHCHALVTHAL